MSQGTTGDRLKTLENKSFNTHVKTLKNKDNLFVYLLKQIGKDS